MTRRVAWSIHVSTVLVGGTGLIYAWMLYLCEPVDAWAVINHPAQPQVQALHVVLAPLLVFFPGLVWRSHVWLRFSSRQEPRRRSGLVLAAALGPMVASGYLLQISVDETWRGIWVGVHVAVSILWLSVYVMHMLLPKEPLIAVPAQGVTALTRPEPAADRSSPVRPSHPTVVREHHPVRP